MDRICYGAGSRRCGHTRRKRLQARGYQGNALSVLYSIHPASALFRPVVHLRGRIAIPHCAHSGLRQCRSNIYANLALQDHLIVAPKEQTGVGMGLFSPLTSCPARLPRGVRQSRRSWRRRLLESAEPVPGCLHLQQHLYRPGCLASWSSSAVHAAIWQSRGARKLQTSNYEL